MPYYIKDPKIKPNFDNHPYIIPKPQTLKSLNPNPETLYIIPKPETLKSLNPKIPKPYI